jgi:hypothetical protein
MVRSRTVQKIFPTHDPQGNPLPPAPARWQIGLIVGVIGLVLVIAGSVVVATVDDDDSSTVVVNNATAAPSDFLGYTYRTSSRSSRPLTRKDGVWMIISGVVFLVAGPGTAFWQRRQTDRAYAAWKTANPGPAAVFEQNGGYGGVKWLTPMEAQAQVMMMQQGLMLGVLQPAQVLGQPQQYPPFGSPSQQQNQQYAFSSSQQQPQQYQPQQQPQQQFYQPPPPNNVPMHIVPGGAGGYTSVPVGGAWGSGPSGMTQPTTQPVVSPMAPGIPGFGLQTY